MRAIATQLDDNKIKRRIFILLTLGIAILLILPKDITWASDRLNYLVYAEHGWVRFIANYDIGILRLLANEPLFLLVNAALGLVFAPENVVKFIIFFSATLTLYSLGKMTRYNIMILIFFLCVPTVLVKYTTHLRQGLAMSIYFYGLSNFLEGNKKGLIRFIAPFIHTSIAFLVLYEGLDYMFKKIRIAFEVKMIFMSIALIGMVAITPHLASFLGDRRAETYSSELGLAGSGVGLLIWIIGGTIYILFKKKDYISTLCIYGIVFFVASYFFLEFGARVLSSLLPLIMASTLTDKNQLFRLIYGFFLLIYGAVGWYSRGGFVF